MSDKLCKIKFAKSMNFTNSDRDESYGYMQITLIKHYS